MLNRRLRRHFSFCKLTNNANNLVPANDSLEKISFINFVLSYLPYKGNKLYTNITNKEIMFPTLFPVNKVPLMS